MGTCYAKHKHTKDIANSTVDVSRQNPGSEIHKMDSQNFHAHPKDFNRDRTSQFREDYDIQEEIGVGSYGKVMRAVHKRTKEIRAVKIVRKEILDPDIKENLYDEIKLLIEFDHPNILKFYEVYQDKYKFYIITELLTGGELFDRIIQQKHLTEALAAKMIKQILSAVAYCHRFGVVHRDLKPENVLLESPGSDNIKIIDFGLAHILKPQQKVLGITGTAMYMAPEVLNGEYNEKCDLWSCGVILYEMLSGQTPFEGVEDEEIFENVKRGTYDFDDPVWDSVSQAGKVFLKKLMTYNPDKRYSAKDALNDPWFKQHLNNRAPDTRLAKEALSRLSTYKSQKKFQEAAWVYLVSFYSSKEDIQNLLEAFRALDKDNDGQLTKEELKEGFVSIMGMSNQMAEEETNRILETLDVNHDGRIDYSEFCSAATSRKLMLTKERLQDLFKTFDRNGDGQINADELRRIFNNDTIKTFSNDTWKRWIDEADKNRDGLISFEEFQDMMMQLIPQQDITPVNRGKNIQPVFGNAITAV